jgi:ABC-type phosphate transport system substrate-binding protein
VKQAYPISTFTWVILPLESSKAAALKTFVKWARTQGQAHGPKLLFQPIPANIRTAGLRTLARIHQ